jgi:hypothetical protein
MSENERTGDEPTSERPGVEFTEWAIGFEPGRSTQNRVVGALYILFPAPGDRSVAESADDVQNPPHSLAEITPAHDRSILQ